MSKIDFKKRKYNIYDILITFIIIIIATLLVLYRITETRGTISMNMQKTTLAWYILLRIVEPYAKTYCQKSFNNTYVDSMADIWSPFFLLDFKNEDYLYLDQIITDTNNNKIIFCLDVVGLRKNTKVFIIVNQCNQQQYIIIGSYIGVHKYVKYSYFMYLDSDDCSKIYLLNEKLDIDLFSDNFHRIYEWGQSKKTKGKIFASYP
jgi:hypothetical protein